MLSKKKFQKTVVLNRKKFKTSMSIEMITIKKIQYL